MVARNSESVACGKRGRIGIVIRRQVAWPRERRLQQADVANARATTMFGQLLFVEDERFGLINPNPVMCHGERLFGEFTKRATAAAHDSTRRKTSTWEIGRASCRDRVCQYV